MSGPKIGRPRERAESGSADPAPPPDLEQCANVVLDTLPKAIADTIREASLVYGRRPVWTTLAGLVLKAYEAGDYQHPPMDPSWPRHFPGVPNPLAAVAVCEYCGQRFAPRRYKQRYCSQDCGQLALQPAD